VAIVGRAVGLRRSVHEDDSASNLRRISRRSKTIGTNLKKRSWAQCRGGNEMNEIINLGCEIILPLPKSLYSHQKHHHQKCNEFGMAVVETSLNKYNESEKSDPGYRQCGYHGENCDGRIVISVMVLVW